MEVSQWGRTGPALVLVAMVVWVAGCTGAKVTTKSSPDLARYQIRSLAFVPLTVLSTPQPQDVGGPYLSSPEGVRRSDVAIAVPPSVELPLKLTMTVPSSAAEKVTQMVWRRLRGREGLQVVPPGDVAKAWSPVSESAKLGAEAGAAMLAKRLKVDAALIGQVLVYQERVGSRMGASPAAAVGFELKLVAADGQVLWTGNYYERQRPMTEDVMGFVQRWAFVTADELAEYGVEEVLKDFPFVAGSPQ